MIHFEDGFDWSVLEMVWEGKEESGWTYVEEMFDGEEERRRF